MNQNIKRIATTTYEKAVASKKIDMSNLESTIDTYVLAVITATVNECSDILKTKAQSQKDEIISSMLKAASVDLRDHFGV
jgi:hypothetical protein